MSIKLARLFPPTFTSQMRQQGWLAHRSTWQVLKLRHKRPPHILLHAKQCSAQAFLRFHYADCGPAAKSSSFRICSMSFDTRASICEAPLEYFSIARPFYYYRFLPTVCVESATHAKLLAGGRMPALCYDTLLWTKVPRTWQLVPHQPPTELCCVLSKLCLAVHCQQKHSNYATPSQRTAC